MSTVADSASPQDLRDVRVQLHPLLMNQVDGRGPDVNIPARTIVLSLGWYVLDNSTTSLLSLDHELRKTTAQQTLGLSPHQSSTNAPVVSDSTIRSALDGWEPERIRAFADGLYRMIKGDGQLGLTLPSGLSLNVGVVDSSSFGNCYTNVISAVADTGTYPLDFVAHDQFKRGKERSAARDMIERWATRFELLLFDGLYVTESVFEALNGSERADALVKYPIKPDRTQGFPWPLDQAQFAIGKGLRETHTIHDDRYDEPATGYRVPVRDRGHMFLVDRFSVDEDGKEDFFTVTTRTDLSIQDTWELSHRRWAIENSGFRALSIRTDSKDQHPKGGPTLPSSVKVVLLFWLCLFQSMFRYLANRFVSDEQLANVKVTEGWLFSCVRTYVDALFNGPRGDP